MCHNKKRQPSPHVLLPVHIFPWHSTSAVRGLALLSRMIALHHQMTQSSMELMALIQKSTRCAGCLCLHLHLHLSLISSKRKRGLFFFPKNSWRPPFSQADSSDRASLSLPCCPCAGGPPPSFLRRSARRPARSARCFPSFRSARCCGPAPAYIRPRCPAPGPGPRVPPRGPATRALQRYHSSASPGSARPPAAP